MVQNVNNAQNTQNAQGGSGNSLLSTAMTALPGVILGGSVGGAMSFFPPSKKLIKEQIADVFVAESKGELKSKHVLELINRPELKEFKEKIGEDLTGAVDDIFKKLPKKDELIKLAKKAAKSKNRMSLIKSGAMFGAMSILLVNLIQSRKSTK